MSTTKPNDAKTKRRAILAVKDPDAVLDKGWFQDPDFCLRFFERCEDEAFLASPRTMDLALRAVQIADANGDPHLHNRSLGLVSYAYLVARDTFWAGKILDMNRHVAVSCCPLCRSDHLRRVGEVLLESRQFEPSLCALRDSQEEGADLLDADALGRLRFIRSIAHHHRGQRDQALQDAGRTLAEMPLESPRGFFVDTPAFLAFFVNAGDSCHDRTALEHLDAFRERIAGFKDWKDWRTRASWVAGHLHARLGHFRRARRYLETAYRHLLDDGFEREATAVTLDLVMLRCRSHDPREDYIREARRLVEKCLHNRSDLKPDHKSGLNNMLDVLKNWPTDAFDVLRSFRGSLVSPVPGLLGERLAVSPRPDLRRPSSSRG